jgi:hypothetical protein
MNAAATFEWTFNDLQSTFTFERLCVCVQSIFGHFLLELNISHIYLVSPKAVAGSLYLKSLASGE